MTQAVAFVTSKHHNDMILSTGAALRTLGEQLRASVVSVEELKTLSFCCPYCGNTSEQVNPRGGKECAGCGHAR